MKSSNPVRRFQKQTIKIKVKVKENLAGEKTPNQKQARKQNKQTNKAIAAKETRQRASRRVD